MMHSFVFILLLLSFSHISQVIAGPLKKCAGRYHQEPAVTRFRRYIQIDTSKEENLNKAVEFWRRQALELGLPFNVFTPGGLPVCVITVLGSDPSLPSIMLNSHMDVVPAVENEWKYPPFSAYMDDNGDIFGRGSQDAKDTTCQYMEAVRMLRKDNVILRRNLHITLMPDEETGGFHGMKAFVKTEPFKAMNVGFVLDEGLPSPDDTLLATYQDRRPWQMQVTVHGESGHGSGMPDDSAMDKARKFMNAVNVYRERMKAVERSVDTHDYGGYTSLNINIIAADHPPDGQMMMSRWLENSGFDWHRTGKDGVHVRRPIPSSGWMWAEYDDMMIVHKGGYRPNVIPSDFSMVVDMRLSTESNITELEQMVQSWITESGPNTELTFIRRDDFSTKTNLDDSNPYWVAMRDTVNEMDLEILPVVCPATSDSLVLRSIGIPSVGFAPKLRTKSLIHSKNEYLNADTFLRGIDIYYGILQTLGNLPLLNVTNAL